MKGWIRVFLIVIFLGTLIFPATLDELIDPMLNKCQFVLGSSFYKSSLRHTTYSGGVKLPSVYEKRYFVLPSVSYGLSDKLQLDISGVYMFPQEFADHTLDPTYLLEINSQENYDLGLRYRVRENLEVNLSGSIKNLSEGTEDMYLSLSRSSTLIRNKKTTFTLEGTWLSGKDHKSDPVKSDLNGLLSPLLDRKQLKISAGMEYSEYKIDYDNSSIIFYSIHESNTKFDYLIVYPSFSYGLGRKLQAGLTLFYYFPFTVYENSFLERGYRNDVKKTSNRISSHYGIKIDLNYRPSTHFQLSVYARYYTAKRYSEQTVYYYFPEDEPKETYGTFNYPARSSFIASTSLNWISKPKSAGVTLKPDLNGLRGPLLNKKQLRLYLSCSHYQINTGNDFDDYKSNTLRARAIYGLFRNLNIGIYYRIAFVDDLLGNMINDTDINIYDNLSFKASFRFRKKVELYLNLDMRDSMYNSFPFIDDLSFINYYQNYRDLDNGHLGGIPSITLGIFWLLN